MLQKRINKTENNIKYFNLVTAKENILQELIKFHQLNSSYVNNVSIKHSYSSFQVDHLNYIEAKFQKIGELLLESEEVEKEYVLQSSTKLLNFYLRELEEINSLEKERLNLLQNERDDSIIKIIEQQRKVIAKETYCLIKCYILISDKLDSINQTSEKNIVERKQFLESFEECKTKCKKIITIYKMQERLASNSLTDNQNYDVLKVDKVIHEFLIVCQEKLNLIKKNSQRIGTEIQNLIQSINELLVDKVHVDVEDSILSKKIASFLPNQIINKEHLMVLNNGCEIETRVLNEGEFITENVFISTDTDINSIIENIKSLIEKELNDNYSSQLSFGENDDIILTQKKIEYQKLEELLINKKWQEADQITTKIFMEVINKKSVINVVFQDLLQFPRNSFQSLDKLWLKHSNNKYGFSVQKKILNQCDEIISSYDNNRNYKNFLKKIGRYKSQSLIGKISTIVDISKENRKGHFPSIIVMNINRGWSCLFDLIDSY